MRSPRARSPRVRCGRISSMAAANAAKVSPPPRINGVLVQEMVRGHEVLIGAIIDEQFGATITIRPGGAMAEAGLRSLRDDGQLLVIGFASVVLTFVGNASTSYVQNLMYHKEAFQFITADLPIMDDASKCVRRQQDGLSLRVWQASDIRNDEMLMRIDILYGMAALRPEWACRITS